MAGDSGAAQEWRAAYDRVSGLALAAGDDAMAVTVPSTPDWTARDLLAHMVGVGIDALAGEVPDDLNPGWTQGHVEARQGASVEHLLAEWAQAADDVEAFVRDTDVSPLGDVVIHEQDLRGALGQPGARDTGGLDAVRTQMLGLLEGEIPDGTAPLRLEADDTAWSWTSSGDGEPGAVVRASQFDLTRAALSRRTEDQLRGWTTSGDVAAYLPAFAHLGPPPQQPLAE